MDEFASVEDRYASLEDEGGSELPTCSPIVDEYVKVEDVGASVEDERG